jgi:hypothetical protein
LVNSLFKISAWYCFLSYKDLSISSLGSPGAPELPEITPDELEGFFSKDS